jgi:ABC-type microcin C transport system permease subunit YejB
LMLNILGTDVWDYVVNILGYAVNILAFCCKLITKYWGADFWEFLKCPGSRPDCMHGIVYTWGAPVTLYNTTTIIAGVCAAGLFSADVKQAHNVLCVCC